METHANHAAIGAFTLVVLSLAFGFIFWIKHYDEGSQRVPFEMQFSGTVSGLAPGAEIFFNGIKVGSVSDISFSASDPNIIRVRSSIEKSTPIKADSQARISTNLLTGVAYVEILGGSANLDDLLAANPPATLIGEPPSDLLPALGRVAGKLDVTVDRLNSFLNDVQPSAKRTVANVETFTSALAANSDGIKDLLANVSDLSSNIKGVSTRLNSIVDAVDPAKVKSTVDNANRVMSDAAKFSSRSLDDLSGAIVDFRRAVNAFQRVAQELEKRPNALIFGGDNVQQYNRK